MKRKHPLEQAAFDAFRKYAETGSKEDESAFLKAMEEWVAVRDAAAPQNDLSTLERAVAYCNGQAIAVPMNQRHRSYNEGVAACVRMLEDMMPLGPITERD